MREVLGVVGLVVLVCIGALLVSCVSIDDAATRRSNAEASAARAQAEIERARGEAAVNLVEAKSAAWQERYMLWTTSMAMFLDSGQGTVAVLSGLLGAVCAAFVIRWLSRLEFLP